MLRERNIFVPGGGIGENAGLSINVFYGNKILRNRLEFKRIL